VSVVLICEWCEKEFSKIRKTAKYCSQDCNAKAWYKRHKERGYVKKEKKPKIKVRKEIVIENCVVCGAEFRKTRKDKTTCGRSCSNKLHYLKKTGALAETYKTSNVVGKVDIANEIEPYLLDWKRRRFFLNEMDLFRVIDLWDKLYPSKFISENIDKTEMFEGMIMDLIFHYKKYIDKKK
jgi:hypothetical protein